MQYTFHDNSDEIEVNVDKKQGLQNQKLIYQLSKRKDIKGAYK